MSARQPGEGDRAGIRPSPVQSERPSPRRPVVRFRRGSCISGVGSRGCRRATAGPSASPLLQTPSYRLDRFVTIAFYLLMYDRCTGICQPEYRPSPSETRRTSPTTPATDLCQHTLQPTRPITGSTDSPLLLEVPRLYYWWLLCDGVPRSAHLNNW